MSIQRDIVTDIMLRLAHLRTQFDQYYLKYKFIGICVSPKTNAEIRDTMLSYSDINFSSLAGLFVRVDKNVKDGTVEVILELPD